ncbi:hypothetical protein ACFLVX_05235 [Chloroflexota bacterium]
MERIKRLLEDSKAIPKVEEKNILLEELKTQGGEKWRDRVALLKYYVSRLLRHIYLRQIDTPKVADERMLKRARTTRNRDYEWIRDSYLLYDQLIHKEDESQLKELIEKRVLEPWEHDTLYEVYVLIKIIEALTTMTDKTKLHLIWPESVRWQKC